MKQHYVMPVGVDDFRRVREEYYYVDKTDFIRQLIDGHAQATLITRPRRFGKTLSLSMLYYFFTNKDAEANRVLFEGSNIEKAGERYMAEQGSRPWTSWKSPTPEPAQPCASPTWKSGCCSRRKS